MNIPGFLTFAHGDVVDLMRDGKKNSLLGLLKVHAAPRASVHLQDLGPVASWK